MYKHNPHQLEFVEFKSPFGTKLKADNRWVELTSIIPWDAIEDLYKENFSNLKRGQEAYSSRIAFGALFIKEKLAITDRETVLRIQENIYLQYFLGFSEFRVDEPFHHSLMTHFRKRFPAESIEQINKIYLTNRSKSEDSFVESVNDSDNTDEANPTHRGKLLVDATVTPADITFPTDIKLLNKGREKLEGIFDTLFKHNTDGSTKPRTYPKVARKEFLTYQKKRSSGSKATRKAIRKQLNYINRDLGHIDMLLDKGISLSVLSKSEYRNLLVVREVYRQQQEMYDERKRRISHRILSISQPHVRAIKRGKAGSNWEFGAKVSIGLCDGATTIHKVSWENFNESKDLQPQLIDYFNTHGYWPESIHADKIYSTKANRDFCKEKEIRFTGEHLGRPFKDLLVRRSKEKQRIADARDRNAVEGKFGEGKRKYGLNQIKAKLSETSETVIHLIFLIMNLEDELRKGAFSFSFSLELIHCLHAQLEKTLNVLNENLTELNSERLKE